MGAPRFRRARLFVLGLLCAMTVLVGCGGDSDGSSDAAGSLDALGDNEGDSTTQTAASGDDDGPSLVGEAEPGAVFTVSGLTISYDEIDAIGADASVEADYGALISPVLEESLEGDTTRYRKQLQHVVNRVASRGRVERVHLLGAAYRELPSLDGGVSIVATVLVDNRGNDEIADVVIDAELRDASGATIADGRFVLGRRIYGEVPERSMMLANLIFPPARVTDDQADLVDRPMLSARVDWEVL